MYPRFRRLSSCLTENSFSARKILEKKERRWSGVSHPQTAAASEATRGQCRERRWWLGRRILMSAQQGNVSFLGFCLERGSLKGLRESPGTVFNIVFLAPTFPDCSCRLPWAGKSKWRKENPQNVFMIQNKVMCISWIWFQQSPEGSSLNSCSPLSPGTGLTSETILESKLGGLGGGLCSDKCVLKKLHIGSLEPIVHRSSQLYFQWLPMVAWN